MTMNDYRLQKVIASLLMLLIVVACNNDASDAVTDYLKHMTEVAVIIENARGQEGATEAAAQILKKRSYINGLARNIESMPESEKTKLLQRHGDRITAVNQRISAALTAQAMRDTKSRRIISDAIMRLERLYGDG